MKFPVDILGVMSGTSLDGVDLCLTRFNFKNETYSFEILKAKTIEYPIFLFDKLKNCRFLSTDDLINLHNDWGSFVGGKIVEEFTSKGLNPTYISTHGHTVFHEPKKGITLQIGSLNHLFDCTKIPIIGDFRALDVFKGGEGAPLVPIGDQLLFYKYDYCLNFGGIANVSFNENGLMKAFDICPCNLLLNYLAELLGFKYDKGGSFAKKGLLNVQLLEQLNGLNFYNLSDKPSLGIEIIESEFFPIIDAFDISVEDKLHTVCEHIAVQISSCIVGDKEVLCTGGGAYNHYLITLLKNKGINAVVPADDIVNYKEALIFAFLGLRKLEGKINVLSSVTGAKSDSIAGCLFEKEL